MKPLFITGIGTDIGKTLISAIIVEKLKADYWKPVQSGDLENSDTHKVQGLISNEKSVFHPEAYRLSEPYSPHKSAALDGIRIEMEHISPPETENRLVIEGAGGLMVPLNERELIVDLIEQLKAEVILVVKNYLGSINHTLLSIELLKQRNIPVKGLIFNGESNSSSEEFILNYSKLPLLGRIPFIDSPDKEKIAALGGEIILGS